MTVDEQILKSIATGDAMALSALLDANPRKIAITGGRYGQPLLHNAAIGRQLDCVKMLLARGADVHARDKGDNALAIHWAAAEGSVPIVQRLIDAGSDIDGDGDLHELGVLGWATCFHRVHEEVANLLLAPGARANIFAAVALNRPDLVRQLRADISRSMSKYEHRRKPLHQAVIKNHAGMVKLLLELGADPHARDDRGNTALALTTRKTDRQVVDLLLAAGADPKDRDTNRFESAIPILSVKNVPASIDYYVNKLGFDKRWDWGEPATFGCVGRDNVEIFLCQDGQGNPGTWMSIFVKDVDALYEDYQKRGAIIRQPPTNFPWGVREMNVEDLDGHRLRIGSGSDGGDDCQPLPED